MGELEEVVGIGDRDREVGSGGGAFERGDHRIPGAVLPPDLGRLEQVDAADDDEQQERDRDAGQPPSAVESMEPEREEEGDADHRWKHVPVGVRPGRDLRDEHAGEREQ